MKKNLLTLYCLLIFSTAYSQKELWGYRTVYNYTDPQNPGINDGMIIKIALEGTNDEVVAMHQFDTSGMLGKFPRGRLFQASDGKLYGVTGYSGMSGGPGVPQGVLFEYDPIVNRYRVLASNLVNAQYGVIEPLPGLLYGLTNNGSSIFRYNINTEEMGIVATIPSFVYNSSNYFPQLNGELMKASDGNLYGTTPMAPSVQNIPYPGGIYKFNLTTNQISKVYVFGLATNAMYPVTDTKLVEAAPGKLYGTSMGGDHTGPQGVAPIGSGTLYEFTIASNTVVKKYDFDYNTMGANPSQIIKSGNKLYGSLFGLTNNNSYPNPDGLLFEYDLAAESLAVLHAFTPATDDSVKYPQGFPLKATDGNFYGRSISGAYQFNPLTNAVTRKIISSSEYDIKDLIEICRKPSYHFFDTASYVICKNTPFQFDIQNDNAATYVWKKGSSVLPLQTTGILNLADPAIADSGIYTCTMTNACGTTVTMPLQLTVENCLGLDEAIGLKNAISLYPNPASGILNLKLPDAMHFIIEQISISNMLGQTVYTGAYNTPRIDIGFLNSGIYQLSIATDKGDWNGKFIKQ